jgi:hypothetical protein
MGLGGETRLNDALTQKSWHYENLIEGGEAFKRSAYPFERAL